MPGTLRSSVYFPAPVVFPAASTIAMRLPIMENPLFIVVAGHAAPVTLCRSPALPEINEPSAARDLEFYFVVVIPFCSASIAALMAWYIWLYPVHRHKLLLNAILISCSVGSGFIESRYLTVIMNPGVQYPHCAPPQSP